MSDTFIEEIVETARKRNGSDLHLRAGRPVLMRTGRLLAPMRETVSSQVMAALLAMIPAEDQEKLAAVGAVTSIIPSLGVRAHFYNESDALRIHLRVLGAEAPRHEKTRSSASRLELARSSWTHSGHRTATRRKEHANRGARWQDPRHGASLDFGNRPSSRIPLRRG